MKSIQGLSGKNKPSQCGAIAIMFGLTLAVMIGFAGLAIDLGRFFVIKAELQNAMDACALAAASQLKPGANDPNALTRAVAYGQVFITAGSAGGGASVPAIQNTVNFQGTVLDPTVLKITFSDTNSGTYNSAALATSNTTKFVKCTYPLANLPIYFMKVLNSALTTQTVSAFAVATRNLPLTSCIPVAVCTTSSGTVANNFGYTAGQWMVALDGSGSKYGTGHFGWAGFTSPSSSSVLTTALEGNSLCDLSNPSQQVYGNGVKTDLAKAWNTRFGVYAPSYKAADYPGSPPDHTGYAYYYDPTAKVGQKGNWFAGANAYSGSSALNIGIPNFVTATAAEKKYDPSPLPTNFVPKNNTVIDPGPAPGSGLGNTNRRVATAPIVDCSLWGKTPTAGAEKNLPVKGWACVLMLNPYNPPSFEANLEFIDLATASNSKCAAGSGLSFAPTLTQ